MSMAMLNESREKYAADKSFRGKIYLIAFLTTVFNFLMLLLGATVLKPLGVIGMIAALAVIVGLYYISGGVQIFLAITFAVAKIAANLATAVAFFVPGIGVLLGWLIGICVGFVVFGYGLMFLYAIPFIMMPLLTFCKERFM